ncbi:MAG: DNA methyltransferase [Candidatus Firestonebacteria bacterium]
MTSYTSVTAEAHTPPYKIHRYFARRPWNVFKNLIETFSKEGDIILDPFCGGGVTLYEGLKVGRKVVGLDLNPLSIFLVRNMIRKKVDFIELNSAFQKISDYLKHLYGDYNLVDCESRQKTLLKEKIEIEWNELTFYAFCNLCGHKVLLSNKNRISNGRYSCSNSSCKGNKNNDGFIEPKNCKRDGYKYLYSVIYSPIDRKKIIIEYDDERNKKLNKHIKFLEKEISKNKIEIGKDEIPLNWDRQYEDLLYKKGIKYFQDLFTKRNLLINLLLLNYISKLNITKDTYEVLRLVFSSSLRDTNIMSFTNSGWQSGKPTTWSKHAYWVPSQFCENNVLSSFKKAFNRVRSAFLFNEQFNYEVIPVNRFDTLRDKGNILLLNASIDEVNIPDNSIDTIITDPPYGSNVQYLELSHFWYVWNKDLYETKTLNFLKEAVANRKKNFVGAKSMKDYENNLFLVFHKSYHVLKPNRHMVLTFNNRDIGAWLALLISIFRAGFTLEKEGLYFQDGVDNYKQTAHTKYDGSPYGDFIYVFKKDTKKKIGLKNMTETDFIKDLDMIFATYLNNFNNSRYDRNEVIRKMFLKVIPKIEIFVKSNLLKSDKHNLYTHFDKNYLRRIYTPNDKKE